MKSMETGKSKQRYRAAFCLLAGISAFMTFFLVIWHVNNPRGFVSSIGINKTALGIPCAWVMAICVALGYITYTARVIPFVRKHIFKFNGLFKYVGIYAAFTGSVVEELVFRKMLMDCLDTNGISVVLQILVSGLAFGLVHLSWLLFGWDKRMGLDAAISTLVLGLLLAMVYIVAERNVLPAIVSHFLIDLFLEPWLILNAIGSTKKTIN